MRFLPFALPAILAVISVRVPSCGRCRTGFGQTGMCLAVVALALCLSSALRAQTTPAVESPSTFAGGLGIPGFGFQWDSIQLDKFGLFMDSGTRFSLHNPGIPQSELWLLGTWSYAKTGPDTASLILQYATTSVLLLGHPLDRVELELTFKWKDDFGLYGTALMDQYNVAGAGYFDDSINFGFAPLPSINVKSESLSWNDALGSLDFMFSVTGQTLYRDTTAKLFWANGTSVANILSSTPIFTHNIPAGFVGESTTIHVLGSNLQNPPNGATHALLVVDPDNRIVETTENDNALALQFGIDLVVSSLEWDINLGGIDFAYSVRGGPLNSAISAKLLWANGTSGANILSSTPIFTHNIPTGSIGESATIHVIGSNLQNPPYGATHIVLIVDADALITEADEVNNVLALRVPEPEIIRQPEDQTVEVGMQVCFEVEATGVVPLSFQWRRNGFETWRGAGSPRLCIPSAQIEDEGSYDVVICNAANCVTSSPAILTVLAPPVFTAPLVPAATRQLEGTPLLRFQAFASGREPIQFRWFKDGQPLAAGPRITGVDYFTLTLQDLLPEDEGNYHVVATNTDGSTNSSAVHLTIVNKPRITHHPIGDTKQVGEPMTFSVEATGTPPFTYQWHKGFVQLIEGVDPRISGVNSPELKIRWLQQNESDDYWVRVCNEAGCTNSNPASLTVIYNVFGPGFLYAPSSLTNIAGGPAIFTADVWGSYPITNQWRKNGQNFGNPTVIPTGPNGGGHPVALALNNIQPSDAGEYDLVVSNPAGSVTSLPATLTVVTNPIILIQPQSRTVLAGATTNFAVGAFGPSPLTYQWRKNGNLLSNGGRINGVNTLNLVLSGVEPGDAGGYDVIVANSYGSVTSAVAMLTLMTGPEITAHPQNRTNLVGSTATFTVSATGTPPLLYQWRKASSPLSNAGNVSGADTPTLTLTGVTEFDAGNYDVAVSNPYGTNLSLTASLTVQPPLPAAPSHLTAVSPQANRVTLTWTDNATNETSFRIERSLNGTTFSDIDTVTANTTSFNDNSVQPATHYYYRVRAANSTGFSPYSNVAEVTTQNASLSILPSTLPVDWILGRPDPSYATSQIVPVAGQPFTQALRVSTLKKPANLWEVQVFVPTTAPVASNDLLRAVFYLRQVQSQPGGEAQAAFLFQRASSPWETSGYFLGAEHLGEWRRYEFLFRALDNYPAGAAQGAFHLGHDTQVIEIGGVSVEHYSHSNTNPPSLLPDILPYGWNFHRPNAGVGLSQIVSVSGQPFTNAIRVTTLQRPAFPHEVQLNLPTIAPVASNAPLLGTFYLRRVGGVDHADTRFVFERSTSPWDISAYLPFSEDTGDWRRFQTVFHAHTNLAAGEAQLNFALGFDPQSIEIGGISLTIIMAPFITVQPVPTATIVGGTASFSVTAVAHAPVHYQWRKGGVPLVNNARISGVTTPTLTLTAGESGDPGNYDVVITNSHGAATSDWAALVLESVPFITQHPQPINATAGDTARFTVTASGTAPLTYHWRRNGAPLTNGGKVSGADALALQITDVHVIEIGDYDVLVSNKWNVVTSQVAHLSVNVPPSVGVIEVGDPSAGVTLVLNGNPGECSLVLRATNPAGPWEIAATIVYGPDGTASFLDGNPPPTQGFYRTEALLSGSLEINAQPISREVTAGGSASFAVSVASCSTATYQWRKDGVNLSDTPPQLTGATGLQLLLANAQFSDAGDYDVVILNASGAITSQVAVLTVVGRPSISAQPASVTNLVGTTASFAVATEGSAPLSYQWRKDGINLSDEGRLAGVQTSQLSITDAQFTDAAGYDLLVANAYGTVTSQVAVLTVVAQPAIQVHPASRTNLLGTPATLTVAATGTGPLAYQWRKAGILLTNSGRIGGAQTAELTVADVQSGDADDYDVMISNPYGCITSQVAVLVVAARPSIVTQPASQTNVAGATALFSIGVEGTDPFDYQWRKDGTNLTDGLTVAGAWSPALAISNLVATDAGGYDVVVTNGYGSITSALAVLTVFVPQTSERLTNILATATSELAQFGRYATNAVNGIYEDSNFWESVGVNQGLGEDRDPAITFDLLSVRSLEKFVIWNGHEPPPSIKRMVLEYSTDGTNFSSLGEIALTTISPASQTNFLNGVVARYIRFDILENGAGQLFPVVGSPTAWSLVAIDEVEFHAYE